MIDYSEHRLRDESELYPFMVKLGQKKYLEYFERVYNKVLALKPGDEIIIDNIVIEENRIMFVKILCLIIQILPTAGYIFNEKFTVFKRCSSSEISDNRSEAQKWRATNVRK